MRLIHYPFRVWQRNLDVFLQVWKAEVAGSLIEPAFVLLVMGYGLGSFIGQIEGKSYIQFIGPGIIAGYAMFSASFECTYGSFARMEIQKTYDAIISTPVSIQDVIIGEILWGATRSLLTSSIIFLTVYIFGLISSPLALLILPLSFLAGLMFSSISLFYTSLSPSFYTFNFFYTLFITPMYFFSGIFFPLSSFPDIVQKLSWIAPLTPVTRLTRALAAGQWEKEFILALLLLFAITTLFLFLSLKFMTRRLIK